MPTPADDAGSPRQGKRVALLVVALVLLAGSIGYNVWRWRTYSVPQSRVQLSNLISRWRCLNCGHELEDVAGRGPKVCPKCQKAEMYVSCGYMCRQHGMKRVALQYDQDEQLVQVKVENGPWVPAVDAEGREGTRCPECGQPMAAVSGGRRRDAGD